MLVWRSIILYCYWFDFLFTVLLQKLISILTGLIAKPLVGDRVSDTSIGWTNKGRIPSMKSYASAGRNISSNNWVADIGGSRTTEFAESNLRVSVVIACNFSAVNNAMCATIWLHGCCCYYSRKTARNCDSNHTSLFLPSTFRHAAEKMTPIFLLARSVSQLNVPLSSQADTMSMRGKRQN